MFGINLLVKRVLLALRQSRRKHLAAVTSSGRPGDRFQGLPEPALAGSHVFISWALVLVSCFLGGLASGEDLAAAIAAGKVSVTFHGTGGSTGDAVEIVVTKRKKDGESLELTIPAGTRLKSGDAGSQSMVIAAVKGEAFGGDRYSPSTTIEATSTPKTYILDAYCAEFEKDNPSSHTGFALGRVDPVLACILSKSSDLSPQARQAAVWMYTDKVNFAQTNEKFSVSQSDWNAARAVVNSCLTKKGR